MWQSGKFGHIRLSPSWSSLKPLSPRGNFQPSWRMVERARRDIPGTRPVSGPLPGSR
jgi:hypothetical protein